MNPFAVVDFFDKLEVYFESNVKVSNEKFLKITYNGENKGLIMIIITATLSKVINSFFTCYFLLF